MDPRGSVLNLLSCPRPMSRVGQAVAVLGVGLLGVTACSGGGGDGALEGGESEVLGDADEGIEGVEAIRVYYAEPVHTESIVDYELRPPAGGIHNPVWWNCSFYDEPVPDEHAVHALEHGAVWLAYDRDLPGAEVEALHDLARADPKLLVAPHPDLADGEAVVATAWARQLRLATVEDDRLAAFIGEYRDGSQAPESGATCVGTPFGEPIP